MFRTCVVAVLVVLVGCGGGADAEVQREVSALMQSAHPCDSAAGCPGDEEEGPDGSTTALTLRFWNNCPQDAHVTLSVRSSPTALASPVVSSRHTLKSTSFSAGPVHVVLGAPLWLTASVLFADGSMLAPVTVEAWPDDPVEMFGFECYGEPVNGPMVWGMMGT